MGDGAFAIHLVDRHFFAIGIVPANRRVDDAFVVGQHAVYNRPVATRDRVVCKNDNAHRDLAMQLKEHSIKRRYRAIVAGVIKENEGTIEGPIGRHPVDRKKMAINYKNGKEAVTHYRVLERFPNATYVECRLETGRTHQIRVHMTSIGHPLLGDEVYGSGKNPYHLQGQTLHAMILGFVHPSTGEYMEFTAPLPEYFEKLLEKLRK